MRLSPIYDDRVKKNAMSPEDLTLLMRALHRDVSELDERLRRLEATIHQMREEAPEFDLRIDVPTRT